MNYPCLGTDRPQLIGNNETTNQICGFPKEHSCVLTNSYLHLCHLAAMKKKFFFSHQLCWRKYPNSCYTKCIVLVLLHECFPLKTWLSTPSPSSRTEGSNTTSVKVIWISPGITPATRQKHQGLDHHFFRVGGEGKLGNFRSMDFSHLLVVVDF